MPPLPVAALLQCSCVSCLAVEPLIKNIAAIRVRVAIVEDVHLRVVIIVRTGDVFQKVVTTYV